jgi:adenine-specific DNA-methyltransferase
MEKLKMHSPDLVAGNIEKIAALFPNCITEAKDATGKLSRAVDFDLLKQELSGSVVEGPQERYRLDWPGKREALLAANAPIAKTLRPVRVDSVDFDKTRNLFIEGDNLEALKLLQESYLRKIRVIYTDPPYNTGSDLIYDDDFSESNESFLLNTNQIGTSGLKLVANTEANGRFHSDWLSMMYPRMKLARNLLSDDGVIFISIGDNEVCNLHKICVEIFGEENFVAIVPRIAKRTSDKGTHFRPTKDYVLAFAKDKAQLPEFGIAKVREEEDYKFLDETGRRYKKSGASLYQPSLDPMRGCANQRYYIEAPDGSLIIPPGKNFPAEKKDGAKIRPVSSDDKVWRWSAATYLKQKHLLIFTEGSARNPLLDENGMQSKWNIYPKVFFDEDVESTLHPEDVIYDYPNSQGTKELNNLSIPFSFAKPTGLISFLVKLIQDKNCTVLDLFAGSASTADAVLQLNAADGGTRKFIMVQISAPYDEPSDNVFEKLETISDIAKERIRRVGIKLKNANATTANGLDIGFRALRIDTSNYQEINQTPDQLMQDNLTLFTNNLKLERTPEDLLFQVMLDWGLDLSLPIASEKIAGKTVYFVDGNALAACFDTDISTELVTALAKHRVDGLPLLKVVFRDAGYSDDSAKINVEQIFKLLSPTTELRTL